MAKWKIRRAEEKDAPALAACIDAAYAIYASRVADLPAVSDDITEEIKNNLVWVALHDKKIVGGMVLVPKSGHAVLANVAVDPTETGAGIGGALMDLAETETRKLGLEVLRLSTHVGIPENVRLYEHLGWLETDRSGNKVNMEKILIN